MTTALKSAAAAALGLAVLTASIAPAHADRNGRIAGGIAAGVIAGAIIAGAASSARASEDRPVRVYSGPDCRDYRNKARWAEDNGQPRRAQYYWDRYSECRGE